MTKPLLMLIDGNALVHRAFHAVPPLTTPKTGEMVNAVYGVAGMLLKVLTDVQPTYCAIAFDKGRSFRKEAFENYKAQRPKTPDELVSQFFWVRQFVEGLSIPVFEVEGYEADDLLGTLSHQADASGIDTLVVTGDADAMQLVSQSVKVLYPGRTFGDPVVYDASKVEEKYGVRPDQMTDFKALMGDPSDNIPGVPGVGGKTAAKLLREFDSIDGLYSDLERVTSAKLMQLLRDHEDEVRRDKELVTMVKDVPVKLDAEKCTTGRANRNDLVNLFRELGFASLLSRLPGSEVERETVQVDSLPDSAYRVVKTMDDLEWMMDGLSAADVLAVDLETTNLNAMMAGLVGISLCAAPGEACYLPVGHNGMLEEQLPLDQTLDRLKPLLESESVVKVGHNIKYDATVLARYGLTLGNIGFDTMVAAHLLGEKSIGLKALAFARLGVEMTPIGALLGKGAKQISMDMVEIRKVSDYSCADADMTFRLKELFEGELRREGLLGLFGEVEMPLVPVLIHMELNGVALDVALLDEMSRTLATQMKKLEADVYNNVGHMFNLNSSQQLSQVLYDELGLRPTRRTKSGYSTEAAVLEELRGAHPVIDGVLEYRQLTKLKSTYLDALPVLVNSETGRVHTTFNQAGTATGRLSSRDPNLQNIPVRGDLGKKIRHAFTAPEGRLLVAGDYSQIDLRVLAHLSGDAALVEAFQRDEDIHAATASRVFGVPMAEITPSMRRSAKTINFGVIYGMSEYGLEQATDFTREEAGDFIRAYFGKYPGVQEYLDSTKKNVATQGYAETLLGRRRYIPEVMSPNYQVREAAHRMAINMPVQGTSADIIKVAMVKLYGEMKRRSLKSRMILQVHDELIFEAPHDEVEELKSLVRKVMPQAVKLCVPVKVDLKEGCNWGEMG